MIKTRKSKQTEDVDSFGAKYVPLQYNGAEHTAKYRLEKHIAGKKET